jgi:hypothetical protein
MVVNIRAARRRARRCVRRLMCGVLVSGVAGMLLAGAGLPRPSFAQDVLRTKSLRAMPRAAGSVPSFGDLLLPPGPPALGMRFGTGSLRPTMIMTFVFNGLGSGGFNGGALTESQTQISGPFSTAQGGSPGSIDTDANSGGLGLSIPVRLNLSTPAQGRPWSPGPLSHPYARPGIPVACLDNQTESQLQAGGQFWTPQARSATPVRFPGAVFIGSRLASKDPLGLGPIGHPVNVSPAGPAGSWCRPPPTPMGQSSPLEYRVFWIVLFFPLGVSLVFWASRGIQIRAVHD